MLLLNRINSINAQVNVFLEEIAQLQAKVTQLQAHAQEVQGAEQAAESALAQIDTALSMLSVICPDEISTFKAAIDAKFNEPLPQISAGNSSNGSHPITEPQPTPPDVDAETIEVTAVVVERGSPASAEGETPALEVEANIENAHGATEIFQSEESTLPNITVERHNRNENENGNGNGNGHQYVTYSELKLVDRPTLIKLANAHGIDGYKSKKKDELAHLLNGGVTEDELEQALNGKQASNQE